MTRQPSTADTAELDTQIADAIAFLKDCALGARTDPAAYDLLTLFGDFISALDALNEVLSADPGPEIREAIARHLLGRVTQ